MSFLENILPHCFPKWGGCGLTWPFVTVGFLSDSSLWASGVFSSPPHNWCGLGFLPVFSLFGAHEPATCLVLIPACSTGMLHILGTGLGVWLPSWSGALTLIFSFCSEVCLGSNGLTWLYSLCSFQASRSSLRSHSEVPPFLTLCNLHEESQHGLKTIQQIAKSFDKSEFQDVIVGSRLNLACIEY